MALMDGVKVKLKLSNVFNIFKLILAVATALNVFVQFLPSCVSIPSSLFLACIFHYDYFPKVASKIYGKFANTWWVKTFITFYAAIGYIVLESPAYSFLVNLYFGMFFAGLLLAWPIGLLYKTASKKPIFKQKFWRVLCQSLGFEVVKEWRNVEQLPPSSLIRKTEEFLWQYVPGLVLTNFFGLVSFLIWFILSMVSKLFAAVLIFWILVYLCKLSKHGTRFQRRKMPTERVKEVLLGVLKALIIGEKGLFGFIAVLTSLGLSCVTVYVWLSFLIVHLKTFNQSYTFTFALFQLFYSLLFLSYVLLSAYQFTFWYIIIKRFPSFVMFWNDRSKKFRAKAIPTGGLAFFGLSCTLMIIMLRMHTLLLDDVKDLIKAANSPVLWIFLALIDSIFMLIIIYLVKSWSKKVSKDLIVDNYIIPSATIISSIPVSYTFITLSINVAIFVIYFALLTAGLFYIPDLRRFLLTRYPKIFKNGETFNIFLYAIFPLFILPTVFLISEIGVMIFACIPALSSSALSITIIKRKALKNKST
jgi:hypothetical protein